MAKTRFLLFTAGKAGVNSGRIYSAAVLKAMMEKAKGPLGQRKLMVYRMPPHTPKPGPEEVVGTVTSMEFEEGKVWVDIVFLPGLEGAGVGRGVSACGTGLLKGKKVTDYELEYLVMKIV